MDLLIGWGMRARERDQLRSMDEHMLKDIGINRSVADVESAKPFWRQ